MAGIRLKRATEPAWVGLYNGGAVLAAPPHTTLVYTARAMADKLFAELMESGEAVTRAGGHISGLPDLTDPIAAKGAHDALFAVSLAELAVLDWKGVNDEDGEALEFRPELVVHLMADSQAADGFLRNYLHPLNEVVAEGNA